MGKFQELIDCSDNDNLETKAIYSRTAIERFNTFCFFNNIEVRINIFKLLQCLIKIEWNTKNSKTNSHLNHDQNNNVKQF